MEDKGSNTGSDVESIQDSSASAAPAETTTLDTGSETVDPSSVPSVTEGTIEGTIEGTEDQRAPDQDKALESAFKEGVLPEKGRRDDDPVDEEQHASEAAAQPNGQIEGTSVSRGPMESAE